MKATFVSVWDGGTEIRTPCTFDDGLVSDIETADVTGLDILTDEFVELPDGTEVRVFKIED